MNTILWVHASWCGHCKRMRPEWARMCRNVDKPYKTMSIESTNLNAYTVAKRLPFLSPTGVKKISQPDGFPSIFVISPMGKIRKFTGERTMEAMHSFAIKKESVKKPEEGPSKTKSTKPKTTKPKSTKPKSTKPKTTKPKTIKKKTITKKKSS